MSFFYSSNIITDNSLLYMHGNNPQELPDQRQQEETFVAYPYGMMKNGQLGTNHVQQIPRQYEWPNTFANRSNWFHKARRALNAGYLHGLYELARPGITPGWPIGDRYTVYTRLRPVAPQPRGTNPPASTSLGTAPSGFEYGSPYDW